MDETVRRVGIEYGVLAATYLFLINAIINILLDPKFNYTLAVSGVLWLCILLLISALFPYGIERDILAKDREGIAVTASISFALFYVFFTVLIAMGFFFFLNLELSYIIPLASAIAIPLLLSAIIFYLTTIWIFRGMNGEYNE